MKKIQYGRYRKEEDSDGDPIYMRVNKKHSKEASREKKQTLERSDTNKQQGHAIFCLRNAYVNAL